MGPTWTHLRSTPLSWTATRELWQPRGPLDKHGQQHADSFWEGQQIQMSMRRGKMDRDHGFDEDAGEFFLGDEDAIQEITIDEERMS